jgi:hypothetical protein
LEEDGWTLNQGEAGIASTPGAVQSLDVLDERIAERRDGGGHQAIVRAW